MRYFYLTLSLMLSCPFFTQALDQERKEEDTRYYNNKLEQQQWDAQRQEWLHQKYTDEAHLLEQKREQERIDAQKREQKRVEARILERKLEDKRRH